MQLAFREFWAFRVWILTKSFRILFYKNKNCEIPPRVLALSKTGSKDEVHWRQEAELLVGV